MSFYAYASYTANGSTQTFSVPFAYLKKADVQAFVNGVADTTFTWASSSTITLTSMPANLAVVTVKRVTPRTANVTFADASTLTETNLNNNTQQLIYLIQEQLDAAALCISVDVDGKYDAGSHVIKNLAAPTTGTDAVNKTYADANAAVTAADVVLTHADVVLTHADVVLTHADVVLTHADVVLTHADVTTAGTSVTAAAASATAAAGSATSAAATLSSAALKANNLSDLASASTARTNLGVAIGADVQAFDADLSALAANATVGLWARTGAGTGSARTLTGTANQISVANGDGSGVPTISLPAAITLPGTLTLGGAVTGGAFEVSATKLKNYSLTVNALGSGSGARTIDYSLGNYVTATNTTTTTFSVTNPPASGIEGEFALELTNGGSGAVTWMSGIKWPSAAAPTLQASGVDILVFLTRDGGTTWRGCLAQGASS